MSPCGPRMARVAGKSRTARCRRAWSISSGVPVTSGAARSALVAPVAEESMLPFALAPFEEQPTVKASTKPRAHLNPIAREDTPSSARADNSRSRTARQRAVRGYESQMEPERDPIRAGVAPASSALEDKEALRRALCELEAAEARVARNAQRVYDETRAKLVAEVLPVLDNLDRTLAAAAHSSDRTLAEGVQMIRSQLEQVVLRYGVERIDAAGDRFDPALHDAVSTAAAGPAQAGRVVAQLEAGYRFAGKVLRPAKVVVGAL